MPELQKPKAVAVLRVSSIKQGLKGDSDDDQLVLVKNKADELGVEIIETFNFQESAADENHQPLSEVVEYCRQSPVFIKYVIVKSIDRFTRAGSQVYMVLKSQFEACGTTIIDTEGVIGGKVINTLEHIGLEYDFSKQNPSEVQEKQKADEAHTERDKILIRLLGASGRYTIKGYATLPAAFGLKTIKVDNDDGERKIYAASPPESEWIQTMFRLRLEGKNDQEVVDLVNNMGYVSRERKIRVDKKVVGKKGLKKLTAKQLNKYLSHPVYAGVNNEKRLIQNKRTDVRERKYIGFDGLVTIDEFNQANRGKVVIVEDGSSPWVTILRDQKPDWQLTKNKDNPDYPYKKYLLCPECNKPFLGSASKGKKSYYPAYHCSRKHRLFRVLRSKVHSLINDFVSHVEFNDEFKEDLIKIVVEEWGKIRQEVGKQSQLITENIKNLQVKRDQIDEVMNSLTNPKYIQEKERQLERIDLDIAAALDAQKRAEKKRLDIQQVINRTYYFMEHLQELILSGEDPLRDGQMFSLLFEELPTYNDILNGTPKLAPLFKLNESYKKTKDLKVSREGLEPPTRKV